MRRRDLLAKVGAGLAWVAGVNSACSTITGRVTLRPELKGHEKQWTLIGSLDWSQDTDGVIYSPVWTQCITRKSGDDLLKREDFAYPSTEALTDTDLSVEFRTYWWSVITAGIVFRAQDSGRFYVVEFYDMGPKGSKYEARLYVQDASGYRRDIGCGFASYPPLPEKWIQGSVSPEDWQQATPGWVQARVLAQGDRIRVVVKDQPVIDVRDGTYASGRAGIVARGPINFRNLKLSGKRGRLAEPWKEIGELPPYFYPWPDPGKQFGDNQTYPGVFRMADGDLGIWMGVNGPPHQPEDVLLVWSRDEGKTWGEPMLFKKRADVGKPGYFFGHKDGRLSCIYATTYDWHKKSSGPHIASSWDGGKTWSKPELLLVSGKPLNDYAKNTRLGPYSPIMSLSDGTLIQFYYEVNLTPEGQVAEDDRRRDRSLLIRSTDDGKTWSGPHYLDPENFDSNETMAVECKDGSLIAFSRTLRAPFMWMSTSPDRGITWTKQVPSNCTGTCPYLLRHSSGALLMGSRSNGVFMKTSLDEGKTWSRETRISLCGGMMGMTEMKDGRVLVVFHEAYRTPTRIRGHYMNVHKDGTLTPA